MKLSRKLPLAFLAASLLVAAAGSVGLVKLNRSIDEYASVIAVDYRNEQAVSAMLVDFKTQVQEWKNVLLRGKDPEQLDKYWKAFEHHDKAVNDAAQALEANLPESQARTLVQQFAQAHLVMGGAYRKGFDAFKAAGFDSAAGDAAVKGQDRKPTDLLNEARTRIVSDTRERVAAAKTSSADATLASALLMLLGFLGAAGGGVWLSRTITRPLEEAVAVAEQVADGHLSVQVSGGGDDETGQLLAALDRMAGNLRQMVARIRSSSDQFNAGASQIATGTVDLSSRTEQQAAALEETASSMEQLAATVRQNTESAASANQLAVAASDVASQGGAVVAQVVDTMSGIHEDARKIAEIISVIDGIAFQTNILALNAAVEAARAGEQGRGFAVVAGEVRALAQRSAAAAKDIKELINDSVTRVTSGSKLAGDAGSTMAQVVTSVQRVRGIMAEILAATREQDAGIDQVNRAVTEMDQTTQQNAALMEEAAAAAQAMREQAHTLSQSVAVFRLEAPTGRPLLRA